MICTGSPLLLRLGLVCDKYVRWGSWKHAELEDYTQVGWGMPSEGTPGRRQEGRTGQREKLTHNEVAAEGPAGLSQ